jgi:SAM-dependent methyltransferase
MSLAATTPAVTGAAHPDFSSRIVTLAASMASLCVIVPLLICAARIIKSSSVLDALFFQRLPILAILFFSAVGVAGYGRLKGLGERWLHDLVETSNEQLAARGEKERSTALYATITVLSGLTLFLELVLIRWQGSLFPVLALYKNFTLLACFCGLGIGYALAHRRPLLLPMTLPLLALTIFLLISLRYASLGDIFFFVPVKEETSVFDLHNMLPEWASAALNIPAYLLLIVTFILNVLIMVPMAQFCGHIMPRANTLAGYGCNLLGSIAGVGLLFLLSWPWTGPVIWFAVAAALLLAYQLVSYELPLERNHYIGLGAAMACIIITTYPVEPMVQNIYSPYQLIQKSTKPDGLMNILSAGAYFQKVHDFSLQNLSRESGQQRKILGYYELPFHTAPSLDSVVVVGAGTGNDVAAALRLGAKAVDAVEIDPAIIALGKANHPEHPYDEAQVNVVNDDARTFFRNSDRTYDAIIYGVLDSHILLSHGSNVRLDSFVYTKEGLAEAYSHLRPGGLMSVSFALPNLRMGFKIYSILSELRGAGAPVAVLTGYDTDKTYTFMVRKDGAVALPIAFMAAHDLVDRTSDFARGWPEKLDVPTDDWPFFYMDARMYPTSYVISPLLVLALAALLVRKLLPDQRWNRSLMPFFFLGAGFMLVETKAITELGLLFGNTWHAIGIAIIGILLMAFLGNLLVAYSGFRSATVSYVLLLATIAVGYAVAVAGGVTQADLSAKLSLVALLTGPLLFSGIVFSTLLKDVEDLPSALAYNLLGAMLGGLLEYNSMEFGFAFLYLIAFALYGLALATTWLWPARAR